MQQVIVLMVLECNILGQHRFQIILQSSLIIGLSPCNTNIGIHTPQEVERRLALIVSCKLDVKLLQGHLCEVVFAVFDSTLTQKVEECVSISIW